MLALALLVATPRVAAAALDPSRAQADVRAATAERAYPFCSQPHKPMSMRARDLCPQAAEIPGCAGFARACGEEDVERFAWLKNLLRAIAAVVPDFVKTLLRDLWRVLFWVFVGGLVLAILVPAARALGRARRDPAPPSRDRGAKAPATVIVPEGAGEEDLLALAESHARRGDNGAALQLYLAASLRALDRRGAVRLAKDRTNGEYVRSCAEEGARPGLREIAREVDRVQFGHAPAGGDAVARTARLAAAIVRFLPVLLLASGLTALVGCGFTLPEAGDDPAGDELFRDLLRKQGVEVVPLEHSLDSLPLPASDDDDDDETPALVIDVDRTPLDDDTRAHLSAWVHAGGVLVLAGAPSRWPSDLGAEADGASSHSVTVRPLSDEPAGEKLEHAELAVPEALRFTGPSARVAWFGDETTYAAEASVGDGHVLGIATDELMTNAGLSRPGNAAAMIAILTNANRTAFQLARPEDGISPPSSPVGTLVRAGLGPALGHALVAAVLLFIAAGVRLSRPEPVPPPERRAFAEHVEAVGALYARTSSAPHALAAYARFAEERLRARMPRGAGDVAAFLAARSGLPLEACQRLWARAASAASPGEPKGRPAGDELVVLGDLAAACAAALAHDK